MDYRTRVPVYSFAFRGVAQKVSGAHSGATVGHPHHAPFEQPAVLSSHPYDRLMTKQDITQIATHAVLDALGESDIVAWVPIADHDAWRIRTRCDRTAIVKRSLGAAREVLALETLAASSVAPRLLATDAEAGVLVMEDVGTATLTDVLTAGDGPRAANCLIDLARTLARMHRQTTPPPASMAPSAKVWPTAAFLNICGALRIVASREARRELLTAEEVLAETTSSLVHGDVCPDNFVVGDHGGRLIDFASAHAGSPHLDSVGLIVPFPTCWQVARLPGGLAERLVAEYKLELMRLISDDDDGRFERAQAAACVYWLVHSVTEKHWMAHRDNPLSPGLASSRQRMLLWLENIRATLMRLGRFHRAAQLADSLRNTVHRRWPELEPAPYYPAFR